MSFWMNRKVIITGGNGFLGSHIHKMLQAVGAECFIPRSGMYDLTEQQDVRKLYQDVKADIVIHCAVLGGGIGFMSKNPGIAFYNNIMMDTLLMEEARKNKIEKFVGIGTVCSYPKFTPVPFREEMLWEGYPEETNAPYGIAKKMMIVQSDAYRKQYGFNSINLLLVNLYGPGDHFHLMNSHVIPALIRKCNTAIRNGDDKLEIWGSGEVSREFLYVEDAARAVILAAEKYNSSEPVNIGSGCEMTIRKLAECIKNQMNFKGELVWNTSYPNGQPRRMLETSKAFKEFDFRAEVDFEQGIQKTIEWFQQCPDIRE